MEIKLAHVGPTGKKFNAAWQGYKDDMEEAMAKLLKAPGSVYGAAVLLVVGICDEAELLTTQPPLLVRSQLLVLDSTGKPKWASVLLEKGILAVAPRPPPPKARRKGASWDEVRAQISDQWVEFSGIKYVRLLDVVNAISSDKTVKNPGQKLESYKKFAGLKHRVDYMQKAHPDGGRGSEPYWLTFEAAKKVYDYELRGKHA